MGIPQYGQNGDGGALSVHKDMGYKLLVSGSYSVPESESGIVYGLDGTAADTTITVTVSGEALAVLDPGQAVVIPLEMGEAIADCQIHAGHYTDGSREATVNVMVAGV